MKMFRFAPIALIDSGIGGLSLLKNLVKKYPNENYIYLADNLNMPYGNKSKKYLVSRLNELIHYLYDNFNVKLVILACNTASMVGLNQLKKSSPVPVVGLNTYSLCKNYTILLGTRLTCKGCTNTHTYPLRTLAQYIEDNIFNKPLLRKKIKRILNKADIQEQNIILGCTHYELVKNEFTAELNNKNIVLPCKEFVDNFNLEHPNLNSNRGSVLMLATISTKSYIDKLWKIFKE